MVSLVRCRSIATCASWLNCIHSCPSDLQWHIWISAVMFHSSRRHQDNGCGPLPPIGAVPPVRLSTVGRRASQVSSANTQRATTFHATSFLHRHSRFSDSVSKHSNFPVHTQVDVFFDDIRHYYTPITGSVKWPVLSICAISNDLQ